MKKLKDFISRYKIDSVNEHITYVQMEYILIALPEKSNYAKAMTLLNEKGLRPATIEDLLSWQDWDKKKQVVAIGSIIEVEGNRYVPCAHAEIVCSPERCWTQSRLGLLNSCYTWTGEVYALTVKESVGE